MNPNPQSTDQAARPLPSEGSGVVSRLPPPRPATQGGKGTRHRILKFAALALCGAALGYFGTRFGLSFLMPVYPKIYKLWALLALPGVWLLVVGWHEVGHLIGGWITGGRFLLLVVGPFMIRRTPAGIRLMWNRQVNLSGGMAACLPLAPGRLTPRTAAVMILGGPVASLALVVVALWLAAVLAAGGGSPIPAVMQHIAVATAGLSSLIFVVTVFPGIAGGFKTDGKRVFDLLRGGPPADQEAAVLLLTTAGLAGARPSDADPSLIKRAVSLGDGSLFDLYGHLTAFSWAADRRDWPQAQQYLDHVLSGEAQLVPYVRDVARCNYAWLLATAGGEASAARAWLESAGKIDFDPTVRLRAEAAVLLAEGRGAEAADRAREGLITLRHHSLSPVENPFIRESLEAIIARAAPARTL